MKDLIKLKIASHETTPHNRYSTSCELTYQDRQVFSGNIEPGDLNVILGYGSTWNCEIPISDITALLLIDYFTSISKHEGSEEESEEWFESLLQYRLINGYKTLKRKMRLKTPKRIRDLCDLLIREDKSIVKAAKK